MSEQTAFASLYTISRNQEMSAVRLLFCLFGFVVLWENAVTIGPLLGAAIAAVAGGIISAGPSFFALVTLGETLVRVNITVENWTKFPMTDPKVFINGGAVDIFPRDIEAGTKEQMIARKTRLSATGSYGTVSWMVHPYNDEAPYRIGVMWSVPYDQNSYSNWLAIGTMHGIPHESWWFDQMYDDKNGSLPNFFYERKEYSSSIQDLVYTGVTFKIHGAMGTRRKPNVKIEVRPIFQDDLADNIKKAVGLPTQVHGFLF